MDFHANYEVLEEIGRGEAATVYRARDLQLKRFVAIKELHEKLRRDPRQMEHFWEEAQFLANLEHENIVQIFGIEKDRGWIIMELMRGSLDTKLAQGPLAHDLVRSVLRQTLEGLKHLHEKGKLHGAVKPANLLINDQGRVKLSDSAGIAAGGVVRKPIGGSFKYMAPELANAALGDVTPAVDLYGVGFTALELLQGARFNELFPGVGADAVDPELGWMRWHGSLTERLPPIEKLMPNLPPDLTQVIGKLVEKEVARRYSSAEEALDDLKKLPLLTVDLPGMAVPKTKKEEVGGQTAPPPTQNSGKKNVKPFKKTGSGPDPWTREWMNKKLEDKRILAAVCAVVLLPALVFMFWPSGPTPVKVTITSTPTGARIFIKDKDREKTTDAEFTMKPGKYKVRLLLAGYKAKEELIDVQKGDDGKKFPFTLDPETRRVVISSTPSKADILIDDKARDVRTEAAVELVVGKKYRLRLEKAGYRDVEEEITVPPGDGDFALPNYKLVAKAPIKEKETGPITEIKPKEKEKVPVVKTPDREGRRFALLVGARDPASRLPEYAYADTDVDALAGILPHAGYKPADLTVLKSEGTGAIVRQQLHSLAANKVAADTVLVVLVGNGVQNGADGASFVPVGSDPAARSSILPIREVYDELKGCAAGVKLLIVDACRTAPGIGAGITAASAGPPPSGVTALFACMAGQQSYRHLDWRHSVFMNAVIRGLAGEANANSDQAVQVIEFKKFVTQKVAEYARSEFPQKSPQTPEFLGTLRPGAVLAQLDPVLAAYSSGCRASHGSQHEAAIKSFNAAVAQDAKFIPALLQRAAAHFYMEKYNETIADCAAAIAVDKQCAEAYAIRGEAGYQSKQPAREAEALQDLTTAIQLASNYPAPYNVRAKLYRDKKDYTHALADHDTAIRQSELDPDLFNERGLTHAFNEQYDKARSDYQAAIKLNPHRAVYYFNISQSYAREKNKQQADYWLEQSKKVRKANESK
jgi:serine/threonine protein kinase/tetratricopeptide (TPR) repeat protein